MERNVKKIVITGGPCGGKTKGLETIQDALTKRGCKVIVVPEAATELITNGVSIGPSGVTIREFQDTILKLQLLHEHVYEEVARKMPQENVVLVCDRGGIDNKAYCSPEEFAEVINDLKHPQRINELLTFLSQNEASIRDNYDAVFHLKTAADGAEEFYTLENNQARTESPELARELDEKTMNAWTGHSHFRVIDNSTNFPLKLGRLTEGIFKFLGLPVPVEIERKFLVKMPNIEELLSKFKAQKVGILQTYLLSDNPDEELRVRQRGHLGDYTYYLTKKSNITNLSRAESEKRISLQEYSSLLMTADTSLRQIRKERYCFIHNNLYFELDVFPFWKDYAILEIELTAENQTIATPSFIDVIKEVTDDLSFRNRSIAREIPAIA